MLRPGSGQLIADVVVAVNHKGELSRVLVEDPDGPSIEVPEIEGNRCHCDVVSTQPRVAREVAKADVSVGRPVEIGIVDDESCPKGRWRPARGARHFLDEMHKGKQRAKTM